MSKPGFNLQYTYTKHIAQNKPFEQAMAVLLEESNARHNEIMVAIKDPLGFGHEGRVAIEREDSEHIPLYSAYISYYVSLPETLLTPLSRQTTRCAVEEPRARAIADSSHSLMSCKPIMTVASSTDSSPRTCPNRIPTRLLVFPRILCGPGTRC